MSIAQMAANIKQRQKIAHVGACWRRYVESKQDTIPTKINMKKQTCANCGVVKYYSFVRCPDCGGE